MSEVDTPIDGPVEESQSLLGIVVDVNLKSEAGGEYLEIRVDPYPNPISYRGEYHYRSGSTKQVLRGAALNRFLLRKHGRNWDDAPLPGVGLRDLDGRTLEEFGRRGIASGRLPADTASDSAGDLIEMLHLREGEYLRRAAVLLFHPVPARFFAGAFVKIGYFRTETELAYQDVIEGNLFAQVDRTVDLLRTKYSKAQITYADIYRRETPLTPGEALREAVLNAIAHRDYGHPAPIQIRVYDDRTALGAGVRRAAEQEVRRSEFTVTPGSSEARDRLFAENHLGIGNWLTLLDEEMGAVLSSRRPSLSFRRSYSSCLDVRNREPASAFVSSRVATVAAQQPVVKPRVAPRAARRLPDKA